MVPYDVQPDPMVSQQAIVAAAPRGLAVGNSANTLAVRQTSYRLRTSASNYARRMIEEDPTREVFIREDGTMYGPGIDKADDDKTTTVCQGTPQDVGSTVHQDDPQDARLERGANANLNRGARNVTTLVATDPLLESTDPQHQPGSMTAHHRTPSPKQGLVNGPQDDGQERGEQVDPQQIPASNSGTSMQDIDGDDEEVQDQIQTPEIPPSWQPAPPSLSYISQELGHDVDTSSLGLATWRPDSPVFDADGLMVEEDRRDQLSQHNSQGHNVDAFATPEIVPG